MFPRPPQSSAPFAPFPTPARGSAVLDVRGINSTRASLDGKTPYDAFVSFYGERGRDFLEKLNVRRINADCVTLDPSLLGPEFKREADNAILRKKGVVE